MNNRNQTVYRLAIDSMMASLYFVLAYFAIKIGNITITPASITIILVAIIYSPVDAISVALVGELINQTAKYGLTITTPLWLIPVLLRTIIISVVAQIFRNHNSYLEKHKVAFYITTISANLITTIANTAVIFLDAYIMNYPVSFALLETVLRFISSLITSIVVTTLSLPILKAVSKINLQREPLKKDKKISKVNPANN